MQNTRRGINRILFCLFLCAGDLAPTEATYFMTLDGSYSLVQKALPDSLATVYAADRGDTAFTDYGGRFLRTWGDWGLGLSLHIYSSFNTRALLGAQSSVTTDLIARKAAETGAVHTFSQGNYRLSSGWAPLQMRARKSWLNGWLFTEIGTGPAYGFGALEYTVSVVSGSVTSTDSRYHKYSEWGWMTSLMVGIDFKLHAGLSVQLFAEGAWLYAKIRNPNLLLSDSIGVSQYFFRPGLAIALRF